MFARFRVVKADDFGNLAVLKSNRLTQVKSDGRQARSTLARTQRKTAEILKDYLPVRPDS
jgi:hypothetical protein